MKTRLDAGWANPWSLLRVGVSLATLALLVHLYDARAAAAMLANVGVRSVVLATALYAVAIAIGGLKWKLLLPDVPLKTLLRGVLAACFYATLPTGQLGGELSKLLIVKESRPQAQGVLASVIFDKLTGVLGLLLIGALALALAARVIPAWQPILVAGLAAGCGFVLLLASQAGRLSSFKPGSERLRRSWHALTSFLQSIQAFARRLGLVLASTGLGVIGQLAIIGVYLVISAALGIRANTVYLVAIVVIANLAALLPISIGGFGVREAGLTSLLSQSGGASGEQALALSLAAMTIFLLWAGVGALVELLVLVRNARRPHSIT